MKLLGCILLACMIIAVLQWAVLALVCVAIVAWGVALVRRPRETLTFMGGIAGLSAFNEHPLIFVGTIAVLVIVGRGVAYRQQSVSLHHQKLRITGK